MPAARVGWLERAGRWAGGREGGRPRTSARTRSVLEVSSLSERIERGLQESFKRELRERERRRESASRGLQESESVERAFREREREGGELDQERPLEATTTPHHVRTSYVCTHTTRSLVMPHEDELKLK